MQNKTLLIITGIVIILAIIGGGYLVMSQQKEQETREVAEEEFWEKQKPRIETFFRYNYRNIESFHYTGTSQDPMGISIEGYVNGDKKLNFSATVTGYETQFSDNSTVSEELGRLSKEPGTYKTVDEIENEQKEND